MTLALALLLVLHGLIHVFGFVKAYGFAERPQLRQPIGSTPIRHYRSFGAARLASGSEARGHEPEGAYAYIEVVIDDIHYNLRSR